MAVRLLVLLVMLHVVVRDVTSMRGLCVHNWFALDNESQCFDVNDECVGVGGFSVLSLAWFVPNIPTISK